LTAKVSPGTAKVESYELEQPGSVGVNLISQVLKIRKLAVASP
jgi:hypothetical protein